jgi:hypothetical protein
LFFDFSAQSLLAKRFFQPSLLFGKDYVILWDTGRGLGKERVIIFSLWNHRLDWKCWPSGNAAVPFFGGRLLYQGMHLRTEWLLLFTTSVASLLAKGYLQPSILFGKDYVILWDTGRGLGKERVIIFSLWNNRLGWKRWQGENAAVPFFGRRLL